MKRSNRHLQVDDDEKVQTITEKIQHVGWGLLALFLIAAGVGAFGNSPLNDKQATQGAVSVEFERFVRQGTQSTLKVKVADGNKTVWIPHKYLEKVEVEQIVPEPKNSLAGQEGILYEFDRIEGSNELVVEFRLTPERPGNLEAKVATSPEAEGVRIRQFAYF